MFLSALQACQRIQTLQTEMEELKGLKKLQDQGGTYITEIPPRSAEQPGEEPGDEVFRGSRARCLDHDT